MCLVYLIVSILKVLLKHSILSIKYALKYNENNIYIMGRYNINLQLRVNQLTQLL